MVWQCLTGKPHPLPLLRTTPTFLISLVTKQITEAANLSLTEVRGFPAHVGLLGNWASLTPKGGVKPSCWLLFYKSHMISWSGFASIDVPQVRAYPK